MAHETTLLSTEVRILRVVNKALSKRRGAKKTRVRQGGVLTVTILKFYPCRTGCLRRLVCEVVRSRVILVLYRSIDVISKSRV
jgi:hypothetical protein